MAAVKAYHLESQWEIYTTKCKDETASVNDHGATELHHLESQWQQPESNSFTEMIQPSRSRGNGADLQNIFVITFIHMSSPN
ncbi:hypothetical protein C5167_034307 [Papaver somniferum]|uniref:Uncharacterized protein n=1 Tax=Papaver somniferum TaxID=3469 RepID=A0A4Y7K8L6_PAPSO|nr:hypothetical protein C5167_034307 [Papaver somniferum]